MRRSRRAARRGSRRTARSTALASTSSDQSEETAARPMKATTGTASSGGTAATSRLRERAHGEGNARPRPARRRAARAGRRAASRRRAGSGTAPPRAGRRATRPGSASGLRPGRRRCRPGRPARRSGAGPSTKRSRSSSGTSAKASVISAPARTAIPARSAIRSRASRTSVAPTAPPSAASWMTESVSTGPRATLLRGLERLSGGGFDGTVAMPPGSAARPEDGVLVAPVLIR